MLHAQCPLSNTHHVFAVVACCRFRVCVCARCMIVLIKWKYKWKKNIYYYEEVHNIRTDVYSDLWLGIHNCIDSHYTVTMRVTIEDFMPSSRFIMHFNDVMRLYERTRILLLKEKNNNRLEESHDYSSFGWSIGWGEMR